MQFISVFLDKFKFSDFQWKNDDASRTQEVFHMIHTFFGYYLSKL